MVSDYSSFKVGSTYWFEDKEGATLLNSGKAEWVYGGSSVQLTMSSNYGQYLTGNVYWFSESEAIVLLNKGVASLVLQSNKFSVAPLNVVNSSGNCAAPGTTSNLAGSVAHTTGNGVRAKQKETVTITVTCGSSTITL